MFVSFTAPLPVSYSRDYLYYILMVMSILSWLLVRTLHQPCVSPQPLFPNVLFRSAAAATASSALRFSSALFPNVLFRLQQAATASSALRFSSTLCCGGNSVDLLLLIACSSACFFSSSSFMNCCLFFRFLVVFFLFPICFCRCCCCCCCFYLVFLVIHCLRLVYEFFLTFDVALPNLAFNRVSSARFSCLV